MNESDVTPLQRAAWEGSVRGIKALLATRVDVDEALPFGLTPLMFAAKEGKFRAVRVLINAGANVNAVATGKTNLDHPFAGLSVLHLAVSAAGLRLEGRLATVRVLLEAGANSNVRDLDGWSPLHYACAPPRVDLILELLSRGARANARTTAGDTPFIVLVRTRAGSARQRLEAASVLIEGGARSGSRNRRGQSAADCATSVRNQRLVRLLRGDG